jgi:hypothetical protein
MWHGFLPHEGPYRCWEMITRLTPGQGYGHIHWDSECNPFMGSGSPLLMAAMQASAPRPSCRIAVMGSGSPANGQTYSGVTDYGPPNGQLGAYRISDSDGVVLGWFFAVQVIVDLDGDENPQNWSVSQFVSETGTVTQRNVRGGSLYYSGQYEEPLHSDHPERGVFRGQRSGQGQISWIDAVGWPRFSNVGAIYTELTNASLMKSFVSLATHNPKSGSLKRHRGR